MSLEQSANAGVMRGAVDGAGGAGGGGSELQAQVEALMQWKGQHEHLMTSCVGPTRPPLPR
jgi:hypothetical protein